MKNASFADIAIVSCGTLSLELNYLKKEGFLDASHLFFTTPGLHEDIHELENQLIQRINKAKEKAAKEENDAKVAAEAFNKEKLETMQKVIKNMVDIETVFHKKILDSVATVGAKADAIKVEEESKV